MIVKPSIAFNDFAGTAKDGNRLSKISRTFRQFSDSQINQWEVLAGYMKGNQKDGNEKENPVFDWKI